MEPKFLTAEEQEKMSAAFRSAKPKERLEAAREYVACLERTATQLRSEVAEQTENNEIRSRALQNMGAEVGVARTTISQLEAKVRELEAELTSVKTGSVADANTMEQLRNQNSELLTALLDKDNRIVELEGECERQRQRAEDSLVGSAPVKSAPPSSKNVRDIGRSQHDKTPVPVGKWNAPRGTF